MPQGSRILGSSMSCGWRQKRTARTMKGKNLSKGVPWHNCYIPHPARFLTTRSDFVTAPESGAIGSTFLAKLLSGSVGQLQRSMMIQRCKFQRGPQKTVPVP